MLARLIRNLGAALAIATAMAGQSPPATAQTTNYCGERDAMIKILRSQYKEGQRGLGIVNQTLLFELFVGPSGGWTMLATNANGKSCLIGSGEDWQDVDVPSAELGIEANPAGM